MKLNNREDQKKKKKKKKEIQMVGKEVSRGKQREANDVQQRETRIRQIKKKKKVQNKRVGCEGERKENTTEPKNKIKKETRYGWKPTTEGRTPQKHKFRQK